MMRSLWTSASGMTAQQLNVDTISNNMANVNTVGYKKERLEFKSLLYQTMATADKDPAVAPTKPVNLQVGLGVRPVATARVFERGNFEITNNKWDMALDGEGFFAIRIGEDSVAYTKDGSFKLSPTEDGLMLVTSEGYPVLSADEEPIVVPSNVSLQNISIKESGEFAFVNEEGIEEPLDFQFEIVQFPNVQGLLSMGGNMYKSTVASGMAVSEINGEVNTRTNIKAGVLEMSNVNVAEEMVKLIVAQRAYELNSKTIQASDDMLSQAANLRR